MLDVILFFAALAAAVVIVNYVYGLIVKIFGADMMIFSARTKLIWYFIVFSIIHSLFN